MALVPAWDRTGVEEKPSRPRLEKLKNNLLWNPDFLFPAGGLPWPALPGEPCHTPWRLVTCLPLHSCILSPRLGVVGGRPVSALNEATRVSFLLPTPFRLLLQSKVVRYHRYHGTSRLGARRKPDYDQADVGPRSQWAPNGHLGAQSFCVCRHSF